MKLIRSLTAAILAAVLAAGMIVPASAAFTDVPANAWYARDVADVQQYGIINGVGNDRFAPDGLLTYAQAITMAARAYAHMKGETIPEDVPEEWSFGASGWYIPYMYYADIRGFLVPDVALSTKDLEDTCPRWYMAELFALVVAGQDNVILNDVKSIPDVEDKSYNKGIYDLYRFGILTGGDKYGTFHPDRTISRAETAAILNRVLDPGKRKSFKLQPKPLLTEKEAIALAVEEAVSLSPSGETGVDRKSGKILETGRNCYVVGVVVGGWWEGEWIGEAQEIYWVDRRSGEVRYVTGLQDYYIPGIVDLETGEYLGYPGGY